jgi:hypothetical protein
MTMRTAHTSSNSPGPYSYTGIMTGEGAGPTSLNGTASPLFRHPCESRGPVRIYTDGYIIMTEGNQGKRGLYQAKRGTSGYGTVPAFPKARAFRALTVLFGGRTDSPEFDAFGDVVQLQDVTA